MDKNPSEVKEDEFVILEPNSTPITIKGRISYNESEQAWNLLRLKKEVIFEFPHLKQKRGSFCYIMKLHKSLNELKKELEDAKKLNVIPIILYLGKDRKDQ